MKPHYFRAADAEGRYWWYCLVGRAVYGGWSRLPFGEAMPPEFERADRP